MGICCGPKDLFEWDKHGIDQTIWPGFFYCQDFVFPFFKLWVVQILLLACFFCLSFFIFYLCGLWCWFEMFFITFSYDRFLTLNVKARLEIFFFGICENYGMSQALRGVMIRVQEQICDDVMQIDVNFFFLKNVWMIFY